MRYTLFFLMILFSLTAKSQQYAKIKKGNHRNIKYSLDNNGDTLRISSQRRIWKVRIIHSDSQQFFDFRHDKYTIDDKYFIPLLEIKGGWHTVVAYDSEGDLNAFRLFKVIDKQKILSEEKDIIEQKVKRTGKIIRYDYVISQESSFSGLVRYGTANIDQVIRLIQKNRLDLLTKNGRNNYLTVIEVYRNGDTEIIYNTHSDGESFLESR